MTIKQTPMIQAVDVWKSFGNLDVLKGIDMEVYPGEVACLIGPSGSGKSTLLRCVNHLEKVNAGRLFVDGELIGYKERDGVLHVPGAVDAAWIPEMRQAVEALPNAVRNGFDFLMARFPEMMEDGGFLRQILTDLTERIRQSALAMLGGTLNTVISAVTTGYQRP